MDPISFEATVIYWRGPSPFFYAPLPAAEAEAIRRVARFVTYGWGVIPVEATIAGVTFKTSLFPKDGTYLLAAEGRGAPQGRHHRRRHDRRRDDPEAGAALAFRPAGRRRRRPAPGRSCSRPRISIEVGLGGLGGLATRGIGWRPVIRWTSLSAGRLRPELGAASGRGRPR